MAKKKKKKKKNWLCWVPKWCTPTGVFGMVIPPVRPPRWMRRWARALNEAPQPPTGEDMAALASSFLAEGFAEQALEISQEILSHPSALEIELDPLTQASLRLISARSSVALGDLESAAAMLRAMPGPEALVEAVRQGQKLP